MKHLKIESLDIQRLFKEISPEGVDGWLTKVLSHEKSISNIDLVIDEAYYGQSLISHKTHKANVQLQQEEFFRQLEQELENEWVKKWICDTLTNRLQGYNLLVAQYKEDVIKSLENLCTNTDNRI